MYSLKMTLPPVTGIILFVIGIAAVRISVYLSTCDIRSFDLAAGLI